MDTLAEKILNERNYFKKLELVYYLKKLTGIYFDNSVILKTELARMFIEDRKLKVDENLVVTACLLCSCKKKKNATNFENILKYAKEGAEFLEQLGFNKRFCKICEEVNRYSNSGIREIESDILEVVDSFGGLVLDRPERKGFPIDEALVLTEYRNFKGFKNNFMDEFKEFVNKNEKIEKNNELLTINDTNGPISSLIKMIKNCEKASIEVNNVINFLGRDRKQVLDEINKYKGKTENIIEKSEEIERKNRAKDFGIGNFNKNSM